jgi:hypothetical protein
VQSLVGLPLIDTSQRDFLSLQKAFNATNAALSTGHITDHAERPRLSRPLPCLSHSDKQPNARINRARRTADTGKLTMKATLFALRLNELLDFVRQ